MIGRTWRWVRRMRDFSEFDRECVLAASVGVSPRDVKDALHHHALGTHWGYTGRDALVVRSLARLASLGVPGDQRRVILVGIVHRWQECWGKANEMPTKDLDRAVLLICETMGKGRIVSRQTFGQFEEIFPQFHQALGISPHSRDVTRWFENYIPAP